MSSQVTQVVHKKYGYTSPLNAYTHLKASFYRVLEYLRLERTPKVIIRGFRHKTPRLRIHITISPNTSKHLRNDGLKSKTYFNTWGFNVRKKGKEVRKSLFRVGLAAAHSCRNYNVTGTKSTRNYIKFGMLILDM